MKPFHSQPEVDQTDRPMWSGPVMALTIAQQVTASEAPLLSPHSTTLHQEPEKAAALDENPLRKLQKS